MRALLALLAAIAAATLAPGDADGQTLCRVFDPELDGVYRGACKDGLADGFGEAKGSAEYRGDFRAGRKHGKGVKTWPSGDRYEGDFVEDRKQGIGIFTWSARGAAAGESYNGAYLDDLRHGFGVYQWPSGDRYTGSWEKDTITGVPTPMMIARARAERAALDALGQTGVKVCRAVTLGIANRDWVRGEVIAVGAGKIAVRIDDPGSESLTLDNVRLVKGAIVWSETKQWTACR